MRHKRFRRIAAAVLIAALAAGLGLWSAAQERVPTVTYTDGAEAHFSFSNTGSGSDHDLFPAFQGCMPGDRLPPHIRVQAGPPARTARPARRSIGVQRSTATPPPRRTAA